MPLQCGTVQRRLHRHRVRIAEIEPLEGLGDDDRRLAVGREVHVVRIVDLDRRSGLARSRIDRREAAVASFSALLATHKRAHVPRRDDVLRIDADLEPVDDLERRRIDHVDVVGLDVRHVDRAAGRRQPLARSCRRSSRCRDWSDRLRAASPAPWRLPERRRACGGPRPGPAPRRACATPRPSQKMRCNDRDHFRKDMTNSSTIA